MSMNSKQYADAWIKHTNSGKSYMRTTFMYPFLEKVIKSLEKPKIVDVGCGWGDALKFVDKRSYYLGIDPTTEFFDYVHTTYGKENILLKRGELPSDIEAPNNYFDLVLCILVIQYTNKLEESMKTLFSKAKKGGKIVIVTFRDDAEESIRAQFGQVYESSPKHIKGIFNLSEGNPTEVDYYFHREGDVEKELSLYGDFKKEYLGPVFVGYECVKN